LRRLHDEIRVTSIFVTHDQEEAFEVADRVAVLRAGRVEQLGSPQDVFDHPANAFVMDFLGNVNVFHGRVRNGTATFGGLRLAAPEHGHEDERPATVYVRPHELEIDHFPGDAARLAATVRHVNPAGPVTRVQLLAEDFGVEIQVELSQARAEELRLRPGDRVYVSPRRARVFAPDYAI
jgi:sulfate transport system ATP-binding protein